MSAPLAFLDTETITLEPGPDVIWEIGLILRDDRHNDEEWRWQIRPNMARAHPRALEVSRFADRFEVPDGESAMQWNPDGKAGPLGVLDVAASVFELLAGRHVVGAVPNFDTERLSLLLDALAITDDSADPWHYHLCDVENLAVGYLAAKAAEYPGSAAADFSPLPPWDSDALTKALGLDPVPAEERHTALGDCRWVRDIWDAVMGGAR
jgi:hypothetical protein